MSDSVVGVIVEGTNKGDVAVAKLQEVVDCGSEARFRVYGNRVRARNSVRTHELDSRNPEIQDRLDVLRRLCAVEDDAIGVQVRNKAAEIVSRARGDSCGNLDNMKLVRKRRT